MTLEAQKKPRKSKMSRKSGDFTGSPGGYQKHKFFDFHR